MRGERRRFLMPSNRAGALGSVRTLADRIVETSDYTVHDLRQAVERHYSQGRRGPGRSLSPSRPSGTNSGCPMIRTCSSICGSCPTALCAGTEAVHRRRLPGQGLRHGQGGFRGVSFPALDFLNTSLPRYRERRKELSHHRLPDAPAGSTARSRCRSWSPSA